MGEAIDRLRHSTDPCGESEQITDLLRQVTSCTTATYRVCTDTTADRNVFDRPFAQTDAVPMRTITWNPLLESALEEGCDGDPVRPLTHDPTASLLHELAHAAQDCAGLDPGAHELEAVRIENIYRRAAGLCQRRGYGDQPLPAQMVRVCAPGNCPCSIPAGPTIHLTTTAAGFPRVPPADGGSGASPNAISP